MEATCAIPFCRNRSKVLIKRGNFQVPVFAPASSRKFRRFSIAVVSSFGIGGGNAMTTTFDIFGDLRSAGQQSVWALQNDVRARSPGQQVEDWPRSLEERVQR